MTQLVAVTAQTARLAINTAVIDRLRSLAGVPAVTVYDGEVPDSPPVTTTGGVPDAAGRVAPYCVCFPTPGSPDPNPVLSAAPTDFLWTGQITFAAGYAADLLHTLDRCVPLLHLWTPDIDGLVCGRMRTRPGTPTVVRRDDDKRPPRFYVPTQWELHVVTNTTP